MDKATKYYKKALVKYHNGYIDEAINLCGASVAENKKYKAAASLKGVLFYFKGDLENARELWDFNVRINKDVVSQKYIENTRNDDELLSVYTEAVHLINQIKISEGLELLRKCEVSDFNVINVSNYIASCLIKQAEFDKAWVYLEKVLNIDKKNKMALDNIKMLTQYGIIEKKHNFNLLIAMLVVLLVFGSGLTYYNTQLNKPSSKKSSTVAKKTETTTTTKKPTTTPKTTTPETTTPKATTPQTTTPPAVKTENKESTSAEKFPYEQVKKDIADSNYDNVFSNIIKWKDKNIDATAKELLDSGKVFLKNNATQYFYTQGRDYSKNRNFKLAADYFYKVYFLGKGELFEHALFFLGSSDESIGNTADAIKYYEEYNSTFPSGSYEDTVLYSLAMLYKSTDMSKAKHYAGLIEENFSDSIYYNSNIKNMLAN